MSEGDLVQWVVGVALGGSLGALLMVLLMVFAVMRQMLRMQAHLDHLENGYVMLMKDLHRRVREQEQVMAHGRVPPDLGERLH